MNTEKIKVRTESGQLMEVRCPQQARQRDRDRARRGHTQRQVHAEPDLKRLSYAAA